jgi:ankyrin repeat protein
MLHAIWCCLGHIEIIKLLLDESYHIPFEAITTTTIIALNINIRSGLENHKPLHMACFQNHLTVVQKLLER